jgi:1,4-alpha-glucan branching enzyme
LTYKDHDTKHKGVQALVRELNRLYKEEKSLHEEDYSWNGFSWLDLHDYERSILSYARRAPSNGETILVVCNFTPVVRHGFRLGVPEEGSYEEILNSDAAIYGGSNVVNTVRASSPTPWHGQAYSIELTVPPLAAVYLKLTD